MWTAAHHTDIYLLHLLFRILSLFVVIISSTPLGRLYSRFRSVALGIYVHSATRALVKSGTEFGVSVIVYPKGPSGVRVMNIQFFPSDL